MDPMLLRLLRHSQMHSDGQTSNFHLHAPYFPGIPRKMPQVLSKPMAQGVWLNEGAIIAVICFTHLFVSE